MIKTILVTGNRGFIRRHEGLFKGLEGHFPTVERMHAGDLSPNRFVSTLLGGYNRVLQNIAPSAVERFWKNERTFGARSRTTEAAIAARAVKPDLVFQLFCGFRPFVTRRDIPYVIYTDYTMAMARTNWPSWSPFRSDAEFAAWTKCERDAYAGASHVFTMGRGARESVIADYGVDPSKVSAVGSAANPRPAPKSPKRFGEKRLLFNGSDWERKGGDLVLEAFETVRKRIPGASLVIIGTKLGSVPPGVENPGKVASREDIDQLFARTDLVLAPARCDPFPTFLLEAMQAGVPCVAACRDGMPEIVDDGVNGAIIHELTADALADKVLSLLDEPSVLASFSLRASEKVRDELNWEAISKKVALVLQNI